MRIDHYRCRCGLGEPVTLRMKNGGTLQGTLLGVNEKEIAFKTALGARDSRSLQEIEEIDWPLADFSSPELRRAARELCRAANLLADQADVTPLRCFAADSLQAQQRLEAAGAPEALELARLLQDETALRERYNSQAVALQAVQAAQTYLADMPEVCRSVCFLCYYSASMYGACMELYTRDLAGEPDAALFRALGLASLFLGSAEAVALYWLNRFYSACPQAALAENELACDPLWLYCLRVCVRLVHCNELPALLQKIALLGPEGQRCAYSSLVYLFHSRGAAACAAEAAAALLQQDEGRARSVGELACLFRRDEDGYCVFAAKAVEAVLQRGVQTVYSDQELNQTRMGYLYDYTEGQRYGRLLGYDLLTYFVPASEILPSSLREIKRSFNRSLHPEGRELLSPRRFTCQISVRAAAYSAKNVQ